MRRPQASPAISAQEWARRGSLAIDLGDLVLARKCFRAAVKGAPETAEYRFNLAVVSEALGERDRAAEQLASALRYDPTSVAAARRLGSLLDQGVLAAETTLDADGLIAALDHATIERDLIAATAYHQLSRHGLLRPALQNARREGALAAARPLCIETTAPLLRDPLFLAALRRGIVTEPSVERLLTAVRRTILIDCAEARLQDLTLVAFVAALMEQGWLNEHVWAIDAQEQAVLERLQAAILVTGTFSRTGKEPLDGPSLLRLALYAPVISLAIDAGSLPPMLHDTPFASALADRIKTDRAIEERKRDLPRLGTIRDAVSLKVSAQYRTDPYPRWTSVRLFKPGQYLKTLSAFLPPDLIERLARPSEVLIAGCGTGRQAVSAAFDYGPQARVAGIDISPSSLGYAAYMRDKLGAKNLHLAVGDIRDITTYQPTMHGRFQIIECVGVLHHMADPLDGWRKLISCLAPRGAMLIGLYNASTRRSLELLRHDAAYPGSDCDLEALRQFRQHLLGRPDGSPGTEFRRSIDFHSASGFRDFFLHVQERCFTIDEIGSFLKEHRLLFKGFVDVPFDALAALDPKETWPGTLAGWARLEKQRPSLFPSMYQFWCMPA